jgi:predicted secreted protein
MGKIAKNGVVKLEYSTDDGSTWNNVTGVRTFDPGSSSSEDVDLTDYDSTGNQREYGNGLKTTQDGNFTINFDEADASHVALQAAEGGAAIKLRHQFDTKYMQFDALIKGVSTPASIGDALVATVTIKQASAPSWVAVA